MTRKVEIGFIVACGMFLSACASLPQLAVKQDALSSSEHLRLGDAYLAHHEKKLTAEQYQAALEQDRHSFPALIALGNLAFEEHDWRKARSYFQRALKAAPNDPAAMNNLAMADLEVGKLKEAKELVTRALPNAGTLKPYLLDTLAEIHRREQL